MLGNNFTKQRVFKCTVGATSPSCPSAKDSTISLHSGGIEWRGNSFSFSVSSSEMWFLGFGRIRSLNKHDASAHNKSKNRFFEAEKFRACKPGMICDRGTFFPSLPDGPTCVCGQGGRGVRKRVSIVRVVREKTDSNDAKNTIRFRSCFSFPHATIPRNTCTDHEEKES